MDSVAAGRLLILDDDEMIAATVARMGEALGFETKISLTAPDFFKQLKEYDPTHAMIDLSMPGMDGLEVMKLIDADCPAKIIIVSGTDNRVLEAARRVGIAHGLDILGILQKPFRLANLKSLLFAPELASPRKAEPEISKAAVLPVFTRDELSDALYRNEFTIYLQPKVQCSDGRIVGFEALARWHHPVHGLVMPGDFVELFDKYELETVWMDKLVRLATTYITSWLPPHIHLSLNMSMSERSKITTPQLLSSVKQDLGVHSERMVIELVENGLIDATPEDIEIFARLRLDGFKLSIDDFGSGYSSLSRLVRIPFSELKIDRTFVKEIRTSDEARKVFRSIIAIGRSLEMSVTAEGVEDLDTLEIVKSLGTDYVQGNIYSEPVPIDQVLPWIDAGGYFSPSQ